MDSGANPKVCPFYFLREKPVLLYYVFEWVPLTLPSEMDPIVDWVINLIKTDVSELVGGCVLATGFWSGNRTLRDDCY